MNKICSFVRPYFFFPLLAGEYWTKDSLARPSAFTERKATKSGTLDKSNSEEWKKSTREREKCMRERAKKRGGLLPLSASVSPAVSEATRRRQVARLVTSHLPGNCLDRLLKSGDQCWFYSKICVEKKTPGEREGRLELDGDHWKETDWHFCCRRIAKEKFSLRWKANQSKCSSVWH